MTHLQVYKLKKTSCRKEGKMPKGRAKQTDWAILGAEVQKSYKFLRLRNTGLKDLDSR